MYNAAVRAYFMDKLGPRSVFASLPIVAETFDRMSHPLSTGVSEDLVFEALDSMREGAEVKEGECR